MYENKKVTKAQIAKLKRQHEARMQAHEKAKAELKAFIRGWCDEKHGNQKILAKESGCSVTALNSYLGANTHAGLVKLLELAEHVNKLSSLR